MGGPDVLGEHGRAEAHAVGHVRVRARQVAGLRRARVQRVLVVTHAQLPHLHLLRLRDLR